MQQTSLAFYRMFDAKGELLYVAKGQAPEKTPGQLLRKTGLSQRKPPPLVCANFSRLTTTITAMKNRGVCCWNRA